MNTSNHLTLKTLAAALGALTITLVLSWTFVLASSSTVLC
jgi:hypothetical protein